MDKWNAACNEIIVYEGYLRKICWLKINLQFQKHP